MRSKPHFNVCLVHMAASHRTPRPSGPRDTLQPLTLLWKKQPRRDPVTSPRPRPRHSGSGTATGFSEAHSLIHHLFRFPSTSSSDPSVFKTANNREMFRSGIQEKPLASPLFSYVCISHSKLPDTRREGEGCFCDS